MSSLKSSTKLILLCFLASPVFAEQISTQAAETTHNTTLEKTIESIRERHNIAAAAYVIVSKDKIIHSGASGVSDKKNARPVTLNTMFRIGSITKSFTALALLKLQEQGKLSLNDTVKQHAADAPINNPWQQTHPVTIAQLLEHTSGLADLTKKEFNHPRVLTLKQGLFFNPRGRKTLWQPGLHSSYSNAGAGYAAYVLEKITGKSFEDYVQEQLFTPLNMTHSGFFFNEKTRQQLATGYDFDGSTAIPYWHMILRPFGAINTTANEMAHFVQMLLNQGQYQGKTIVNKNSIQRMQTPKTTLAASSGLTFGYGLGSNQHIHNGFIFHGHSGDGDGYLARYAYNQEINRGYFVVINAFNHRAINQIQTQIEDFITAGRKKPAIQKSIELKASQLKPFTGKYKLATHRFPWDKKAQNGKIKLEVILNNRSLHLKTSDNRMQKVVPLSSNLFRYEDEPVATMAFVKYQGKIYLQNEDGNYQKMNSKN